MKKSKRLENLKLKTETVVVLTPAQLAEAIGGLPRERTLVATCSCINCNTGQSSECDYSNPC